MFNIVLRIAGIIVFFIAWCFLLAMWVGHDADVISSDALYYSNAATSLVQQGFYSFDGLHPLFEREPGYSFFLALIYLLFGNGNLVAVFIAQALLYFIASYAFCSEIHRQSGGRIASLGFFFLLIFPGSLRSIFMLYRESFTLALFMLLACAFFALVRKPSGLMSALAGILMGALILTYYSFLFLPLFFAPLLLFIWRIPKRYTLTFLVVAYIFVSLWGLRNWLQDGRFRIVDSFRTTVMWFVRAEQAEHVTGTEPFMCLWAEYISRDWSERSPACSTTGVFHQKWPDGRLLGSEMQIAKESQVRIFRHFPSYLWFSVFEVLELHLPFLGGGWPFGFNLLASIGSAIIYLGGFLSLFAKHPKTHLFFLTIIIYSTLVFSLTDATPRYIMPTIFAYITLAAVGYSHVLSLRKGSSARPLTNS